MSLKDKVKITYDVQEDAKRQVRLKDRFYHPRDKEGKLDPRNGGYEFKGEEDVVPEKDPGD